MSMIAVDPDDAPVPHPAAARRAAAAGLPFSAIELAVIHLGAGDDPSTLREPGWPGRIVRFLLGVARRNRLADPRLETLRRTMLLLRVDGDLAPVDRERFIAAGFSGDQLDLLRLFARS